ncbi:hypothetical protein E2C01_024786 [Portunus trituberculatus]|uniref:G-protein coupled receptors family 1 profile domain-containing protein n=1 Tax=Portunus trituberculatus TaxID=210409 RepID=A0A5B7EE61_PORTR|nr:hypothetical protein [Portunus trituberculatus]
MLVVVMMVVPILAGARLVFGVAMNHYFCQSSVTAHSQAYFSLPRKVRYKVIVLFITTLACWTPVMIERVLYAWLQVDQLSSVPTSLLLFLLLLGHMQNLLRAVFYISHHRNEQARVSVLSNSEDSLSSQSNTPSRARGRGAFVQISSASLSSVCPSSTTVACPLGLLSCSGDSRSSPANSQLVFNLSGFCVYTQHRSPHNDSLLSSSLLGPHIPIWETSWSVSPIPCPKTMRMHTKKKSPFRDIALNILCQTKL